jgi:hypothetical protein
MNIILYNFTCDSSWVNDLFAHICAATLKSSQLAVSIQDFKIAIHLKEELYFWGMIHSYSLLTADLPLFHTDFHFVFHYRYILSVTVCNKYMGTISVSNEQMNSKVCIHHQDNLSQILMLIFQNDSLFFRKMIDFVEHITFM